MNKYHFHREGAKKREEFNSISFFAFLRAFALESLRICLLS